MTTKNWKYALLVAGIFSASSAIGQSLESGKKALEMEQYRVAKKTLSKVAKTDNNELNKSAPVTSCACVPKAGMIVCSVVVESTITIADSLDASCVLRFLRKLA